MKDFGKRVIALRKQLKLTKRDLAATMGISPSALCRYEKGDRYPDFKNLIKLKEGLSGVNLDYLVSGSKLQECSQCKTLRIKLKEWLSVE